MSLGILYWLGLKKGAAACVCAHATSQIQDVSYEYGFAVTHASKSNPMNELNKLSLDRVMHAFGPATKGRKPPPPQNPRAAVLFLFL